MEFDLAADGTLTPLPQQNIDTGLGLERGAMLLQDVGSIFDTDGYQAIMRWVAEESGVAYGDSEQATKAHRVLADHGRGDGLPHLRGDHAVERGPRLHPPPPDPPRGLAGARIGLDRRLPLPRDRRRAGRAVVPGGRRARRRDRARRPAEEERFRETLERGMKEFEELAGEDDLGEDAFTLAATYGFPIELTVELASERGQPVDVDGYRGDGASTARSRAAGASGLAARGGLRRGAGFATEFVGYAKVDVLTQIGALEELGDGTFLAKLRESPFYPAGGGQVTDQGWIERDGPVAARELVDAYRFERRPGARLPRRGLRGRRPRARGRAVERALPDDGEPHRDAPAPGGAARGARRARHAGGLGRAPGQAALRLHARAAADAEERERDRAARQPRDLREPPVAPSRRRSTRRASSAR
jgi:alanyl-tRNA synthetase